MGTTKIIFACLAITMASCREKPNPDDQISHAHATHDHSHGDPRAAEIMAMHDSIMPNMAILLSLSERLTKEMILTDSGSADKKSISLTNNQRIQSLLKELEASDEAMMSWMHAYKTDSLKKMSDQDATLYISELREELAAIKIKMDNDIREAREFLNKVN
jgi:hypothetical protein